MNYWKNLPIGRKFLFVGILFLVASILSIFGMYEISQTRMLTNLERDHMAYTTYINFRGHEYINLLKNGSEDDLTQAREVMAAQSEQIEKKGLTQLSEEGLKLPHRVLTDTN
ncbi:MAG: hypothetical protein SV487_10770, partial [Thermodesulfobacteriota bacterium]|nr:hypothetical protein [Thermodesulfobacteriota bacterium]